MRDAFCQPAGYEISACASKLKRSIDHSVPFRTCCRCSCFLVGVFASFRLCGYRLIFRMSSACLCWCWLADVLPAENGHRKHSFPLVFWDSIHALTILQLHRSNWTDHLNVLPWTDDLILEISEQNVRVLSRMIWRNVFEKGRMLQDETQLERTSCLVYPPKANLDKPTIVLSFFSRTDPIRPPDPFLKTLHHSVEMQCPPQGLSEEITRHERQQSNTTPNPIYNHEKTRLETSSFHHIQLSDSSKIKE